MKTTIGELKKLIKEAAGGRQLLSQEQVRQEFPGAIEALEYDDVGREQLADPDYLKFYKDANGDLLLSNYEISYIGWQRWDAQAHEWVETEG